MFGLCVTLMATVSLGLWKSITWMLKMSTADPGIIPSEREEREREREKERKRERENGVRKGS